MQLTRFDRWLRERFTQETHIYTMRPAAVLPARVKAYNLPTDTGGTYQHRYVSRNERATRDLIRILNEHNQMHATRVIDRKVWYARFIAPEGKSFSWRLLSFMVMTIGFVSAARWLYSLWMNPQMRSNLTDTFNLFFSSPK